MKVLTGMRRSGKSTLMRMVMDELATMGRSRDNMIYISFEEGKNAHLKSWEPLYNHIIEMASGIDGRVYIFIDELQEVDEWQLCIRALMVDIDSDIYITGSSSKMLSGEMATHIAGRYIEIGVRPFSFAEVVEFEKQRGSGLTTKELFEKYRVMGGMPYIIKNGLDVDDARSYISSTFDSVVIRDICIRKAVRKTELLDDIIRYATSEIGHAISSINITNYLKSQKRSASVDTVLDYMGYAVEARYMDKVFRQDLKGKSLLKTDYRYYLTDVGFREALNLDNGAAVDQILENLVYNELVVRGYRVTIGRTAGDHEIDFVADRNGKREYYQVSYLMSTEETRKREFGAFSDVPDNYPKYVLSMDEIDMSRDGIVHRNIVDWLAEGPR
ncbi:MAG: ATP-binding protein [Thermoplasmata archaeon]|nr:ATP-binding protein [Thermoplasmata archaeon]